MATGFRWVVLPAFCSLSWWGCYAIDSIQRDSIPDDKDLSIVKVVTLDDSVVTFQDYQGKLGMLCDSVITGKRADPPSGPVRMANGDRVYRKTVIPLVRAHHIDVQRLQGNLTLLTALAVVTVGLAILLPQIKFGGAILE